MSLLRAELAVWRLVSQAVAASSWRHRSSSSRDRWSRDMRTTTSAARPRPSHRRRRSAEHFAVSSWPFPWLIFPNIHSKIRCGFPVDDGCIILCSIIIKGYDNVQFDSFWQMSQNSFTVGLSCQLAAKRLSYFQPHMKHVDYTTKWKLFGRISHKNTGSRCFCFHKISNKTYVGTAINHLVPNRVKPSFVIFDIRVLWPADLEWPHGRRDISKIIDHISSSS